MDRKAEQGVGIFEAGEALIRHAAKAQELLEGAFQARPPRKLCPLDRHLMPASLDYCPGCEMEWQVDAEAARDKAAGRDETTIADEEKYGEEE